VKTSASASLHLAHLHKLGVLATRQSRVYPPAVRREATAEVTRYRDEGLIVQSKKEINMAASQDGHKPMLLSGFCAHPSNEASHLKCTNKRCPCDCHKKERVFSGQGIIFAVIDDREKMGAGKRTTIDIITEAIEAALDAGHETSEDIARYITTSAFQHERDRRVRFNSVLKAGDTVGAQITQKLYNTYNELAQTADEQDEEELAEIAEAEARGFAEALNIVINPFSSEDKKDPTLVNWTEIDRITAAFEEEQRAIREEEEE
jgi:hypothetical protein